MLLHKITPLDTYFNINITEHEQSWTVYKVCLDLVVSFEPGVKTNKELRRGVHDTAKVSDASRETLSRHERLRPG